MKRSYASDLVLLFRFNDQLKIVAATISKKKLYFSTIKSAQGIEPSFCR